VRDDPLRGAGLGDLVPGGAQQLRQRRAGNASNRMSGSPGTLTMNPDLAMM